MATLPETLKKLKADKHVLKQEIEEIKRLFIEQNGRTPSRRDLSGDGQKKYTRYEEASAAFHHCQGAKTALDARFGGAQIDSARVVWAAEKREPLAIDDDSEAHTALITVVILLDTDRAVAFAQLTGEKNAELSEGVFELGCVRSLPDVQSQLRVTSSAGRLSISIEQPPPVVIASPGTAIANAPETSTDLPVPGEISLTSESSVDGGVSGTGAGDANEELVSEQPPAAGIVDKSQLTEDCSGISGNSGARTSSATTKPRQGKKKSARVMPAGENEERDGKKRAGNEEKDNGASKRVKEMTRGGERVGATTDAWRLSMPGRRLTAAVTILLMAVVLSAAHFDRLDRRNATVLLGLLGTLLLLVAAAPVLHDAA